MGIKVPIHKAFVFKIQNFIKKFLRVDFIKYFICMVFDFVHDKFS